ncbi:hypothetical protein DOTSEDRAFT_129701 [Dothistroma septosporum NZE10]|uniref:F-box domain-containing protein n=1 Tax=Dothistroma septosporum (strain NZE10 / CBS 128990) TaxID=675120 RepID=N1PQC0_DOTSN|nr:hypothetical protein DOTSEDRAFT_129701 [Dothistroma septosporum NZE10]
MALSAPFDACNRFFAINELVTIFLEHATPRVLVNSQRVCRVWNVIIQKSDTLQEHLFLKPTWHQDESEINPFIGECFGSVLSVNGATHDRMSSIADIQRLAWATDDANLEAPARQAFARGEASWRRMLVCQPPVSRLGWWHQWKTSPIPSEENEDSYADPFNVSKGWGHQDLRRKLVTMAMVWDIVEARLSRGCRARVTYHLHGSDNVDDHSVLAIEQAAHMANPEESNLSEVPRVMIHTVQVWSRRPTGYEHFSRMKFDWYIPKDVQLRKYNPFNGDGFNTLRTDCLRDIGAARPFLHGTPAPTKRWSQSDSANDWNEDDGDIFFGIGARQAGRQTIFVARQFAHANETPTVFAATLNAVT